MRKFLLMLGLGTFIAMSQAEPRDIYLHGGFNDWKNLEEYKFEPVNGSENHYRLIVTLPAASSSNPHKFKVYDDVGEGKAYRGSSSSSDKEIDLNGKVKSLNSHQGTGNESSVTLSAGQELRLCFEYWAKWKFSGDDDNKYHSALKVTTCPETLYLYGHVQGKDWNSGEYYSADETDGVYTFKNVSIAGRAGSENYVAFYGAEPTATNYSSLFPRYGGNKADKNIDSDHSNGENVVILESDFTADNNNTVTKNIDVVMEKPEYDSNFRLHDGVYDITVDLPNSLMTVTKNGVYTGIDTIETTQSESVYYDLTGRRVAKPEKGFYIEVNGSRVTKKLSQP